MKTLLLIEIVFCSIMLLIITIGFIYYCAKEKSFLCFIVAIIGICLLGYFPACVLSYSANKYFTQPEPTNKIEQHINGVSLTQYQDVSHFCYVSDKNPTVFTSWLSAEGTTSQDDICLICRRPFLYHDTHKEHRFYELLIEISEHYSMYY